jgi:outer membrane protein
LKRIITLLLAAVLLIPAFPAIAVDLKIGFVDAERIRRESGPAQKAQKKLEKEFAERDKELQKVAKQVKDLQSSLEKDGVTMSESDKRNKEQELARFNREFQRMQREFREDLNLRKNEELGGIIERADKVIKSIAEAEKFDLILQEAVFRSSRIDITDKVIKALAAEK